MARTKGSQESFTRCANLIEQADGLLITAGAGLGMDAGLPDFRGKDGFWRAYPTLGRRAGTAPASLARTGLEAMRGIASAPLERGFLDR